MRVLIGCEESATVRDSFRARAVDAYSCDLQASRGNSKFHITGDVFMAIKKRGPWDMLIAFPPCTHIAVSGARYFAQKIEKQRLALEFMRALLEANVPRVCIENPVGVFSTWWRKPDQIVQPYMFGDDASKKTCLWLRNLPQLRVPPKEAWFPPRRVGDRLRWSNQTDSGQNRLGPSPTRAAVRATTYPGIAFAMAEQWSNINLGGKS